MDRREWLAALGVGGVGLTAASADDHGEKKVDGKYMAAVAGFFYAHYITFVGPDQLMSPQTFLIWSMVIVGGLGNNLGVIAGAFMLQFAMAYVPFIKDVFHLPTDFTAAARLTIVGGVLLIFLLWRPAGLFPERVGDRNVT